MLTPSLTTQPHKAMTTQKTGQEQEALRRVAIATRAAFDAYGLAAGGVYQDSQEWRDTYNLLDAINTAATNRYQEAVEHYEELKRLRAENGRLLDQNAEIMEAAVQDHARLRAVNAQLVGALEELYSWACDNTNGAGAVVALSRQREHARQALATARGGEGGAQ